MENWVKPNAKRLGSETIEPDWNKAVRKNEFAPSDKIGGRGFNKEWIQIKIEEGYYIYDVGTPPNSNLSPSLNYSLELGTVKGLNYGRTFKVIHYRKISIIRYK